jgi:nucleoside-diphosphate-sugar epimerase
MRKVISITGSNGFIGSNLKKYFLSLGYRVNCLASIAPEITEPGVTYFQYNLTNPLDELTFPAADILFHCAYMPYSKAANDSNAVNTKAAHNLIQLCRLKNTKIVFFSSLSAHAESRSHYGKNKLFLEGLFDINKDLILKLGLVVGEGGIFAKMQNIIRRNKMIPLIDSGRQLIQTVSIETLLTITKVAVDQDIVGKFNIGEAAPLTLKDIYLLIGKNNNRKNYFLPVSSNFLLAVLKMTESAGLVLPISRENVLGLKYIKVWNTQDDMQIFKLPGC